MKVNFFTAQIKLWGRIFDYKGKSTKKEYWFAFLFHAILGLLACACIALSAAALIFTGFRYDWHIQDLAKIAHYVFLIPGIILTAYLAIAVIPWISLTVRRLRDGGKSAWWALLLLIVGVGHILLFIICVSASGIAGIFNPSRNVPEGIYGPPEWFNPSNNTNENVYGPPEWFDPSYNTNEDVYGPPPFDIDDDNDDFDPNQNITEPVYGPPSWYDDYDPSQNEQPTVYGPPEWFNDDEDVYKPDININEDVYGPPEWFNDDEDVYKPDINMNGQVYGPPEWFE